MDNQQNLLFNACNLDNVIKLLDNGAEIDIKDNDGNTPLHISGGKLNKLFLFSFFI